MTHQQTKDTADTEDEIDQGGIDIERRRLIGRGALGVAGAAVGLSLAGSAGADPRTPVSAAPNRVNPQGRFRGKVVLVTGATSGIGEATARAFAREGAKVGFNGRREALGRSVEASIRAFGGEATYVRSDVRDERQVRDFVRAIADKYGRLDIAFNNAGIVTPRPLPFAEQPMDVVDDVFSTNTMGVWRAMRHELPIMVAQESGCIVNCASVGGYKGYPGISPYSASKAAVLSMTRTAARDYGRRNIRVVSISPGGVDTPMRTAAIRAQGGNAAESPPPNAIGRANTVEEMARAVMWLASDEGSFMTGCDVDVTSGQIAV